MKLNERLVMSSLLGEGGGALMMMVDDLGGGVWVPKKGRFEINY